MKEIRSLTAMRGLFALWVLAFHLRAFAPFAFRIVGRGYLGVDFFFLLSGFVLARTYGHKFLVSWSPNAYWRFLALRFGRLFPLHLALITAMAIVILITGARPLTIGQYVREATLIQAWNVFAERYTPINGAAWSISTEWAVNLGFPLLVAITLGRSAITALILSVGSLAGIVYVASMHDWSVDVWEPTSLRQMLRCLCEFTLGLAAYRFRAVVGFMPRDSVLAGLIGLIAVAIFAKGNDLLIIALMIPMLIAAAENVTAGQRALSVRPIYWLGTISYSFYLTQQSILEIVKAAAAALPDLSDSARDTATAAGTLIGTLVVSHLTYRLIEVPARDWIKVRTNAFFQRRETGTKLETSRPG